MNPSLGTAPKVGPLSADQVVPWTAIFLTSYYVCKSILGLSWLWTGIVAAWGMSTWWVLTGSKAWRFLSKFVSTPNWTRGYASYRPILDINIIKSEVKEKRSQKVPQLRRRQKRG